MQEKKERIEVAERREKMKWTDLCKESIVKEILLLVFQSESIVSVDVTSRILCTFKSKLYHVFQDCKSFSWWEE